MDYTNFLDQSTSLTLVIGISVFFAFIGLVYAKKHQGLNNYLTANRKIPFPFVPPSMSHHNCFVTKIESLDARLHRIEICY